MNKSHFSLEGKVALVTGGSRGIGEATAIGFAKAGADVAIASRKLPDLEKVAEKINSLGRSSLPVAAHIGRLEDIDNLVNKVTEHFGRIDILVNNAGTHPTLSPMLDIYERLWDSIMNLNLKGLVFLSKAVARIMKEHGGGSIINVSSVAGLRQGPNIGTYSISKAGVIMATTLMADEWAKYNIRVNALAPGHFPTLLGNSIFNVVPGYEQELLKKIPLGRMGDLEEIADIMVFLASDASSYVTGATLVADGGLILR